MEGWADGYGDVSVKEVKKNKVVFLESVCSCRTVFL